MMNRQYLLSRIAGIESKRNALQWLSPYVIQADKIANFGCNIGVETLASMWLFRAREGVGLDIDAERILQAREDLHVLQEEAQEAHNALDYPWVDKGDRRWWSEAPEFFTRHILESDFSLASFCVNIA